MAIVVVDISKAKTGVFDANGREVSLEEQAALARQWGRPDYADEILGIERPWYVRLWRAISR
jgi:hypothetical protein